MPSYSIDEMRSFVAKVYGGTAWKDKVADMPDEQVIAIYYSFQERGASDNGKSGKRRERRKKEKRRYDPYERFTDESDRDYYDRINEEL